MSFDYGDPERNQAERERVTEQGRAAARAGLTCFGAGGYMPGDSERAHLWLTGFAEINPNHPDMRSRYRTDGGASTLEKLEAR